MAASLDALLPELQPFAHDLVNIAGSAGLVPRVTSTRRSFAEQVRLYARHLAGRSLYPTAFPGTSAHEYGEAFDLVVSPYEAIYELGAIWQSMGGTWGGSSDPIHFELPGASQSHKHAYIGNIGLVADLLISFVPWIGATELAAELLKLGFPHSEVLQFLSGPVEYVVTR